MSRTQDGVRSVVDIRTEGEGASGMEDAYMPALQQADHLLMLHSTCRLHAMLLANHQYDICPWPPVSLRPPNQRSYPTDVAPFFSSCCTFRVLHGRLDDLVTTEQPLISLRRLSILSPRLVAV